MTGKQGKGSYLGCSKIKSHGCVLKLGVRSQKNGVPVSEEELLEIKDQKCLFDFQVDSWLAEPV